MQSWRNLFSAINDLVQLLDYGSGKMIFVRFVTIPDDSLVWIEENKFKTNKMFLSERKLISDLDDWNDCSYYLPAIKKMFMHYLILRIQLQKFWFNVVKLMIVHLDVL